MKLYILTLRGYDTLGENIIKVFSTKETLEKWLSYADLMEKELYGPTIDPSMSISKKYKIKEADLDNLDWIDLYANARELGAQAKPSQPQ